MVELLTKNGTVGSKWDLKPLVLREIGIKGGFTNAHAHIDRAYTITPETLNLANAPLQQKWSMVDTIKRESTVGQIYDRMSACVETMIQQGVTTLGTFIDVDEVVRDKAIRAGSLVRDRYRGDIRIVFVNQTLKGVLTPQAKGWFDVGAGFVDIIGGLPGKDKGREDEHLDVVLGTARAMGKMAHVHVDQLNNPLERETELLTDKTIEHGMGGKVVAIHGISIGTHPVEYRRILYQKMQQAGMMVVSCPTAWIDGQRSEVLAPIHNSITPVEEMIPVGITVGLGTDNIADLYKPFTCGDMWTELRFMLECCRFYDIDNLARIASVNGRRVLGLEKANGVPNMIS